MTANAQAVSSPDAIGLAAARAAQEAASPNTVILFGSRPGETTVRTPTLTFS